MSERRWHCAWTHPNQEYRAEMSVMELGFRAFLPLHIDRAGTERHIVPAFRGYILILFSTSLDQWRRIYRARGVAGIISATTDRPTPFPPGVIEELLGRTSERRIVDDPDDAPPAQHPSKGSHWQDMTNLSAKARTDLMLRLFGRVEMAA